MANETITTKLKEIFSEVFPDVDDSSFDIEKDRNEYENWDSLTHLQLVSEIESGFGVSFEMDEVVEINSAQDLANVIEKKQNG